MKFEYYHEGLATTPKLSVDGTVDNAIHFSHWKGNQTPASLKADTSTEIALNLVSAANRDELTQGIDLVTNNHFDTDGVLSVWTVLNGDRARPLSEKLIAAAEAGDFSELSSVDGVRASIVIQGSDSPLDNTGSPLAQLLGGSNIDDAGKYDLVLPQVENILTRIDDYEALWRKAWDRIALALDSFERGASRVEEDRDVNLSMITLDAEIFSPSGFKPTRHAAPFTAISHHARGELFLIATPFEGHWAYRIDYPYYSWAETIVRQPITRRDFQPLLHKLNELDAGTAGVWRVDSSELASAAKCSDQRGQLAASRLSPEVVAEQLKSFLANSQTAAMSS
jgi:hypothetical protein